MKVPLDRQTPEALRQRFAHPPSIQGPVEPGIFDLEFRPAAVLVPLVQRDEGFTVLLTQRTDHLHKHAGQVSFPGGGADPADASPVHTALREAEEEIGLDPRQVELLGFLPRYWTGTGYEITPVVGLVTPPLDLKLDNFEVAEAFEVPLDFLLDPANHQEREVEWQGAMRRYYVMPYEGYHIWGATAGMLVTLYRFLAA
ncbi:MAG: CoA pyrophosphatase [Rhodocyclaceae bacterium]|jgi:8-oxo-dGTP pyrophosphatase MutT (NUDIX family)|nr:CoA pyrophosphatase [Rhodocyclaceae bacterium]